MLNDRKLKSLKPRDKIYKVADRDGIYVTVSPAGAISFRLVLAACPGCPSPVLRRQRPPLLIGLKEFRRGHIVG